MNKKMRFPPTLIVAIQAANVLQVSRLLAVSDGILRQLDESEDRLWREALNLAIRLGNEDIINVLLECVKFDFRQIHEALLVAVDTNQPTVVKRLLDRLDHEKGVGNNKVDIRSFSLAIFDHSIDNSHFAPGVTPLTLACQKDLYEIVEMLTKKGHVIPRPHKVSCTCLECRNGRQYDLLKFSLSRINTFRGIASRAYLSIGSEDAMLSAFRLSRELKRLSKKEPEFKPQYLSLEDLCQEFAVELLGMCRNQSEVTTILNDCGDDSEEELDQQTFEEGIPNLARLRLAVNHNQKRDQRFYSKNINLLPGVPFYINTGQPQYLSLEDLCQEFAVELLGMCRNQSEVTTILNDCGDDSEEELDQQTFEEGIPNLARLRLAFVAHPICQQVLSSIWCGNLSGWRGSKTAWKIFISLGIFITMPVLCLIYWLAPKSKIGKILKIPVIKFLLHSASYLWFLIFLLAESIIMESDREHFSSRNQSILQNSFHMVWVVGTYDLQHYLSRVTSFFWHECKEVWIEGMRNYLLDWWNFLDIMTLSMYLASFSLRVLVALKGYFYCLESETTLECVYFTQTECPLICLGRYLLTS
ncbi:UNVERIFIED_CONTAM: hypothetical protein FKN15_007136 [Acipenser sinensis]